MKKTSQQIKPRDQKNLFDSWAQDVKKTMHANWTESKTKLTGCKLQSVGSKKKTYIFSAQYSQKQKGTCYILWKYLKMPWTLYNTSLSEPTLINNQSEKLVTNKSDSRWLALVREH